jgi:integrase
MQTADIYAIFCEVNNIAFKKPKYTRKCPIPIIPRTEHVEAIIASSSKRMATIFRILSETAIEGYELEIIPQKQIDPEQGIISVVGVKRHLNGTYTLKTETAEMLRQYLAKHPEEYPFPKVKNIREAWMNSRKTTANKLGNPQIAKIPLKNLRNYAGAIFYLTMGKDPMQTMYFMRHSNLKTTTDYLRGLKEFTAKTELISKLVTTPEEALELINQGFKETSIFAQGTPNEKHILTEIQKIDVSEGVEERRESEQTKNRYEQLKTVMNLIYEGEKIE